MKRSCNGVSTRGLLNEPAASIMVGAALAVTLGCSTTQTVGEPGEGSESERPSPACSSTVGGTAPALVLPAPFALPTSRVVLSAYAPFDRIASEVDKQIPKNLASATKKPIGAPGVVTYQVTRGRPEVKLAGDRLLVEFTATASVEVCKPIGPVCPVYGQCRPSLRSKAQIPLLLGADYDVGESRVGLDVLRPCSIAGLDVTDKMLSAAQGASRDAKRQIDESVPPLRPMVEQAWTAAHTPIALPKGGCMRIEPRRILQAKPAADADGVNLAFAIEGAVTVDDVCLAASEKPLPLPPLSHVESLDPESHLAVVALAEWGAIQEQLEAALVGPGGAAPPAEPASAARVSHVEVKGHATETGPTVAIRLTLEGPTCGDVWVYARPHVREGQVHLRIAGASESGEAVDRAISMLRPRIEGVVLTVPPSLELAQASLALVPREYVAQAPISIAASTQIREVRVREALVGPDGIGFVGGAVGNLRVEAR